MPEDVLLLEHDRGAAAARPPSRRGWEAARRRVARSRPAQTQPRPRRHHLSTSALFLPPIVWDSSSAVDPLSMSAGQSADIALSLRGRGPSSIAQEGPMRSMGKVRGFSPKWRQPPHPPVASQRAPPSPARGEGLVGEFGSQCMREFGIGEITLWPPRAGTAGADARRPGWGAPLSAPWSDPTPRHGRG